MISQWVFCEERPTRRNKNKMMEADDESTPGVTTTNQDNEEQDEVFVRDPIAPAPASAPPETPTLSEDEDCDCNNKEHQESRPSAKDEENNKMTKDQDDNKPSILPMGAKSSDYSSIEEGFAKSLHLQPFPAENRTISLAEESLTSLDFEDGADDHQQITPLPSLSAPSVASLPHKRNKQIQTCLSMDERTISHEKLRSYEANRRSVYESKLHSSSTYWYSFRKMLECSLEETKRVELLIRAAVLADANYANHLKAAVDGMLLPDGSPISPSQQPTMKESSRHATSTHSNKCEDTLVTSPTSPPRNSVSSPTEVMANNNNNICSPFEKCLREISFRFGEEATLMQKGVVTQIINLREKLEKDVSSMVRLGNVIHEEMNAAEENVKDSWSECLGVSCEQIWSSIHVLVG